MDLLLKQIEIHYFSYINSEPWAVHILLFQYSIGAFDERRT